MNWNPKYSPLWRWLGAHGVALITGAAAYVSQNPAVLSDPTAQKAALGIFATTALSWTLGANMPSAPPKP